MGVQKNKPSDEEQLRQKWKALGFSFDSQRGAYVRLGNRRRADGSIVKSVTHYFGTDIQAAYQKLTLMKAEWKEIKNRAKDQSKMFDTEITPVWKGQAPDDESQDGAANSDFESEDGFPENPATPQLCKFSVQDAMNLFIDHQRKHRLNNPKKKGIVNCTLQNQIRLLKVALGPILHVSDVRNINFKMFEKFIAHWESRPMTRYGRPLSERSVEDYLKRVQQLFTWLENRPDIDYRLPQGVMQLFRDSTRGGTTHKPYQYFTYEELKQILADAPERTQLYIMIALNTGHLNVDIAAICFGVEGPGYISKLDLNAAQPYLRKTREKTKRKHKEPVEHWLWPETVVLMKKFLNPDQRPEALCFLNEIGQSLYDYGTAQKRDNIHTSWERLKRKYQTGKAKDKVCQYPGGRQSLIFKDLRKTAAHEIHMISGSEDIANYFDGHKLREVSGAYLKPLTERMNDAVKKFGEQLRNAGVFNFNTNTESSA